MLLCLHDGTFAPRISQIQGGFVGQDFGEVVMLPREPVDNLSYQIEAMAQADRRLTLIAAPVANTVTPHASAR